jgi:hypothetical protein
LILGDERRVLFKRGCGDQRVGDKRYCFSNSTALSEIATQLINLKPSKKEFKALQFELVAATNYQFHLCDSAGRQCRITFKPLNAVNCGVYTAPCVYQDVGIEASSRPDSNYSTPPIKRLTGRLMSNKTIPSATVHMATELNNWTKPMLSIFPASKPAIRFPNEVARNQMPIICPTSFAGDSFVIALKPTGLKQSSPVVWKKYVATSQAIVTLFG